MAAWSSLLRNIYAPLSNNLKNGKKGVLTEMLIIRQGHHRTFVMKESNWQYHKFKDMLHYYVMLALIPMSLIVLYTNVFIGQAKLAPIPEGYVPKHWEYYSHPISRFIARYGFTNQQQDYERYLHFLYQQDERFKIKQLDKKIRLLIRDRHDYQAWYHRPIDANYTRIEAEIAQELKERAAST